MTFFTQPQDAIVVVGGDATFLCAGEENGMALQFIWDFTPVGGLRGAVNTGSNLTGVSMVTVNGDRTQLTLSGVQREVDERRLYCAAQLDPLAMSTLIQPQSLFSVSGS